MRVAFIIFFTIVVFLVVGEVLLNRKWIHQITYKNEHIFICPHCYNYVRVPYYDKKEQEVKRKPPAVCPNCGREVPQ